MRPVNHAKNLRDKKLAPDSTIRSVAKNILDTKDERDFNDFERAVIREAISRNIVMRVKENAPPKWWHNEVGVMYDALPDNEKGRDAWNKAQQESAFLSKHAKIAHTVIDRFFKTERDDAIDAFKKLVARGLSEREALNALLPRQQWLYQYGDKKSLKYKGNKLFPPLRIDSLREDTKAAILAKIKAKNRKFEYAELLKGEEIPEIAKKEPKEKKKAIEKPAPKKPALERKEKTTKKKSTEEKTSTQKKILEQQEREATIEQEEKLEPEKQAALKETPKEATEKSTELEQLTKNTNDLLQENINEIAIAIENNNKKLVKNLTHDLYLNIVAAEEKRITIQQIVKDNLGQMREAYRKFYLSLAKQGKESGFPQPDGLEFQ